MSTVLQRVAPGALETPAINYSSEQLQLIKDVYAKGATDEEFQLFIAVAQYRKLDILKRQICLVPFYDKDLKRKVFQPVTTIDGYRSKAEETGRYEGQAPVEWCGKDGVWHDVWIEEAPPIAARVGIYRSGFREPLYAVARFSSYAKRYPDGNLMGQWATMPDLMLAKCFDESTEVLTDQGFQKFSEVTGRILQVTDGGLEPCDARPFSQHYDGDMVTLESDDLNFSVTPNHDMVTTQGKIEAGTMFDMARSRPAFWIPRCVAGSKSCQPVSNEEIQLAAAYLADGTDHNEREFKIEVSRPNKIDALREIGNYRVEGLRKCAGAVAHTSSRDLVTRSDKASFVYDYSLIEWLCSRGKQINTGALISLSREQTRVFVDTLVDFDGHTQASGVRRFYTSRPDHIAAFELACVIAGYSVSNRKERTSDIGTCPNLYVTVSDRNEIPVIRWGRSYNNLQNGGQKRRTGLVITANSSGKVWCVTVPSGVIVVRRNGFSMLCGNCAESLALRKAFPEQLGGLYTQDEMEQADNPSSGAPDPKPHHRTQAAAVSPEEAAVNEALYQHCLKIKKTEKNAKPFFESQYAKLSLAEKQHAALDLGLTVATPTNPVIEAEVVKEEIGEV